MHMANILMSMIFSGVLERYPALRHRASARRGIGWIPYILERMDAEWEDQFKDLVLKMKPSEYWQRQCYATYQTDPDRHQAARRAGRGQGHVGLGLPASRRHLARLDASTSSGSSAICPPSVQRKIVCDNAAHLYGFSLA